MPMTIDAYNFERLDALVAGLSPATGSILPGAGETLWRTRPVLLIEVEDERGLRAAAEEARAFGYRCFRSEAEGFMVDNFNRRDSDPLAAARALALVGVPEERELAVVPRACVELFV